MNGPHLSDEISALLDGELDPHEADAAKAHLRECALCTAELAVFNRVRSLVQELPVVDAPGVLRLVEPAPDTAAETRPQRLALLASAAATVALLLFQGVQSERAVVPQVNQLAGTVAGAQGGRAIKGVHAPYDAPLWLEGDYQRVGAYRQGEVVHLAYSDGEHDLSVFAQAGKLDTGDMPKGGAAMSLDGRKALHYAKADRVVLTWESDGVVYTAVGDAPVEDLAAAAASLPGARRLGVMDRMRRSCRGLVETLTGA